MIFNQCPICGRYMIPNMSETSGWYQCVCGYDSRSYSYTYSNHSSDFAYGKERKMSRLIDADELALKLRYMGYMDEHEEVQEVIDSAPTVDVVSKEKYETSQEVRKILVEFADDLLAELKERVEVVKCKDCKYFTLNFVENVDGVPLIVAHEICSFWGDGCKTSQEGFCSFGERKEEE